MESRRVRDRTLVLFAVCLLASTTLGLSMFPEVSAVQGPKVDTLYFKMFYGPGPEWTALKAGDIDIMEWSLTRAQYDEWSKGGAPGVEVARTKDHGMFEIDINCNYTVDGLPDAVYNRPGVKSLTSLAEFRQVMALCLDKVEINKVDFGGMAEILDTPLAEPIHEYYIYPLVANMWRVPGANWYVPPNSLAKAANWLTNVAGFGVDTDTPNPYYDGYPGSSPYMRKYPANWPGRPGSPTMVSDKVSNHDALFAYIRADKPDMLLTGRRLVLNLRRLGIPVRPTETTASVCCREVMTLFGYHFYTGGWSLPIDPDHVHDFYSAEFGNPMDYNYCLFNGQDGANTGSMPYSIIWDYDVNGMGPSDRRVAKIDGVWQWPVYDANGWDGQAWEAAIDEVKYAATKDDMKAAIAFVMNVTYGEYGLMPFIPHSRYSPSYTGYRTGWKDLVCEEGGGVGGWWSHVAGYKPGTTSMRSGLCYPVIALNMVTSEWPWDHFVLSRIYDTLMSVDPYDPAKTDVLTGMAEWWRVTTYGDPPLTQVSFRLRGPPYNLTPKWHDGSNVTISDVAFSILYHQAQYAWWYSSVMDVVDVATHDGGTVPPGATGTWTADPALGPRDIRVKFGVLSWMGLHWIGFLPIIKQSIWTNVPYAYDYNPITDDANNNDVFDLIEDGSGPYVFVDFVADDHVTLSAFRQYFLSQEEITNFKKEAFRRQGDVDLNAVVDTPDLSVVAGAYSLIPYQTPPRWAHPKYPDMVYSEPVLAGAAPPDGTILKAPDDYEKYADMNGNNEWGIDEPAIRDADNDGQYDCEDVLAGDAPPDGTALKAPDDFERYADMNGDKDWNPNEPAIRDNNKNRKYDAGDDVLAGDAPPDGTRLRAADDYEKYADYRDPNNEWDIGEPAIRDANNNWQYDCEDVLAGDAPPDGTALKAPDDYERYADKDTDNDWDKDEPAIADANNNWQYDAPVPYITGRSVPDSPPPLNNPWNLKDVNYDNYIKSEDLAAIAESGIGRNSGSGPGW